jgi:hypothetical protein
MSTSSMLFSYIDPVSGVILLQLAIGGCIGCCAFFHKKIVKGLRLLNLFGNSEPKTDLQESAKPPPEEL